MSAAPQEPTDAQPADFARLPSVLSLPFDLMTYYETRTHVIVVATNALKEDFRILQFTKSNTRLSYIFDPSVYRREQAVAYVNRMKGLEATANSSSNSNGALLSSGRARGIIGFARFTKGYYMVLIKDRRLVTKLGPHSIYEVQDVAYVSLCEPSAEGLFAKLRYDDEDRYLGMFKSFDLRRYFYYSHTYDLTNTLQTNMTRPTNVMRGWERKAAAEVVRRRVREEKQQRDGSCGDRAGTTRPFGTPIASPPPQPHADDKEVAKDGPLPPAATTEVAGLNDDSALPSAGPSTTVETVKTTAVNSLRNTPPPQQGQGGNENTTPNEADGEEDEEEEEEEDGTPYPSSIRDAPSLAASRRSKFIWNHFLLQPTQDAVLCGEDEGEAASRSAEGQPQPLGSAGTYDSSARRAAEWRAWVVPIIHGCISEAELLRSPAPRLNHDGTPYQPPPPPVRKIAPEDEFREADRAAKAAAAAANANNGSNTARGQQQLPQSPAFSIASNMSPSITGAPSPFASASAASPGLVNSSNIHHHHGSYSSPFSPSASASASVAAAKSKGPIKVLLIGRSSKKFAGTRYLKRGINGDGYVANHVEVEQIVYDPSTLSRNDTLGAFSSFVQVRGSVPVAWFHPPVNRPKPPIVIGFNEPLYGYTRLHMEDLLEDFGAPIVVVNLLKSAKAERKKSREKFLSEEYKKALLTLASIAKPPSAISSHPVNVEVSDANDDGSITHLLAVPPENTNASGNGAPQQQRRPPRKLFATDFAAGEEDREVERLARYCEQTQRAVESLAGRVSLREGGGGGGSVTKTSSGLSPSSSNGIGKLNEETTNDDGAANSDSDDLCGYPDDSPLHIRPFSDQLPLPLPWRLLQYVEFDLRNSSDKAWNSMTSIAEARIPQVGLFSCDASGAVRGLQCGVLRSNCVDCIDRTNLGQFFFGLHAIGEQLRAVGVIKDRTDTCHSAGLNELVLELYLRLGDAIAIQYGGSAQVGAGLLHRGLGWDKIMGIRRLYTNLLVDKDRQMVTNLFLGLYTPTCRGNAVSGGGAVGGCTAAAPATGGASSDTLRVGPLASSAAMGASADGSGGPNSSGSPQSSAATLGVPAGSGGSAALSATTLGAGRYAALSGSPQPSSARFAAAGGSPLDAAGGMGGRQGSSSAGSSAVPSTKSNRGGAVGSGGRASDLQSAMALAMERTRQQMQLEAAAAEAAAKNSANSSKKKNQKRFASPYRKKNGTPAAGQRMGVPFHVHVERNFLGKVVSATTDAERLIDISDLESDYYLHTTAPTPPGRVARDWWRGPLMAYHRRRDPYFGTPYAASAPVVLPPAHHLAAASATVAASNAAANAAARNAAEEGRADSVAMVPAAVTAFPGGDFAAALAAAVGSDAAATTTSPTGAAGADVELDLEPPQSPTAPLHRLLTAPQTDVVGTWHDFSSAARYSRLLRHTTVTPLTLQQQQVMPHGNVLSCRSAAQHQQYLRHTRAMGDHHELLVEGGGAAREPFRKAMRREKRRRAAATAAATAAGASSSAASPSISITSSSSRGAHQQQTFGSMSAPYSRLAAIARVYPSANMPIPPSFVTIDHGGLVCEPTEEEMEVMAGQVALAVQMGLDEGVIEPERVTPADANDVRLACTLLTTDAHTTFALKRAPFLTIDHKPIQRLSQSALVLSVDPSFVSQRPQLHSFKSFAESIRESYFAAEEEKYRSLPFWQGPTPPRGYPWRFDPAKDARRTRSSFSPPAALLNVAYGGTKATMWEWRNRRMPNEEVQFLATSIYHHGSPLDNERDWPCEQLCFVIRSLDPDLPEEYIDRVRDVLGGSSSVYFMRATTNDAFGPEYTTYTDNLRRVLTAVASSFTQVALLKPAQESLATLAAAAAASTAAAAGVGGIAVAGGFVSAHQQFAHELAASPEDRAHYQLEATVVDYGDDGKPKVIPRPAKHYTDAIPEVSPFWTYGTDTKELLCSAVSSLRLVQPTISTFSRFIDAPLTPSNIEESLVRLMLELTHPVTGIPLSNCKRFCRTADTSLAAAVAMVNCFSMPVFTAWVEENSAAVGLKFHRMPPRRRLVAVRQFADLLVNSGIIVKADVPAPGTTGIVISATSTRDYEDEGVLFAFANAAGQQLLNVVGGFDSRMHYLQESRAVEVSLTVASTAFSILEAYESFIGDGWNGREPFKELPRLAAIATYLQSADITPLCVEERICFFINVYNALYIHAWIHAHQALRPISMVAFYQTMCYSIGGHTYSLHDIKHGVLRGNTPSSLMLFPQFLLDDARKVLSVGFVAELTGRLVYALVDTYVVHERASYVNSYNAGAKKALNHDDPMLTMCGDHCSDNDSSDDDGEGDGAGGGGGSEGGKQQQQQRGGSSTAAHHSTARSIVGDGSEHSHHSGGSGQGGGAFGAGAGGFVGAAARVLDVPWLRGQRGKTAEAANICRAMDPATLYKDLAELEIQFAYRTMGWALPGARLRQANAMSDQTYGSGGGSGVGGASGGSSPTSAVAAAAAAKSGASSPHRQRIVSAAYADEGGGRPKINDGRGRHPSDLPPEIVALRAQSAAHFGALAQHQSVGGGGGSSGGVGGLPSAGGGGGGLLPHSGATELARDDRVKLVQPLAGLEEFGGDAEDILGRIEKIASEHNKLRRIARESALRKSQLRRGQQQATQLLQQQAPHLPSLSPSPATNITGGLYYN